MSLSNTAAVVRLYRKWPQMAGGVEPSEIDKWETWLKEQVSLHEKSLNPKDPGAAECVDAAYRVAHTSWALEQPAPDSLGEWASEFAKSWLLRKHPRFPCLYLLDLVSRCGCCDTPTNSLLAGVAEDILWYQLASAGTNNAEFNPIELALALRLAGPGLSPRHRKIAVAALNQSAISNGTWLVAPPIAGTGIPACSSLYALLVLIGGFDTVSPDGNSGGDALLLPSICAHARWLCDGAIEDDGGRLASDLRFRLPDAEPWFNCLAAEFAQIGRDRLARTVREQILGRYSVRHDLTGALAWSELAIESDVRKALDDGFISPAQKLPPGAKLERSTAILFGPPGTAKTTIAESIAREVGWPLVEVGISDFLSKGMDGVFAQSKSVFDDLLALERFVVLLDEVEGVFASRDGEEAEAFQKLLTSSLLPPLKRLRDKAQLIVLVATNHISRFDAAVKRPGRIDLVLPVGPPNLAQRKSLLLKSGVYNSVIDAVCHVVGDRATIGELLAVKRFSADAKSDSNLFAEEWKRYLGPKGGLISEAEFADFQRAAVESKRLT